MSDDADDDWFEGALDDEESAASTAADDDGSGATGDDALDDSAEEPFGDSEADAQFDESDDSGAFGGESGVADSDGTGAFGDSSGNDGFGDTGGDTSAFGDVGTDGDSAFGDSGSGDALGSDTDDGLFDDDFANAMGGVGGGDADFEDEDFESNIPRLDLGIEGLDNMVQGGIPLRHLIVIVGGAGTGKTTFGLQFLQHGLEKEDTDRGVFITLEQTYEDIMATAEERGWEFERHEEEGNLAVIDLDPVEMANSLDNIRGELPDLIEDFDADRFVLDSVSLLEMMYEDVSRRRTEVFDFTQSLKEAGVTTVLTSEANENNPYASRHGIIEYLTDAVFLLRYVRSETQETRLAVEIQKIRNANHSRETKPYEITMDGISVYEQANIF
ncbi:circadian clock protein KaiC [Halosimplex carlsbadense 2-9-1]|uniref:Circadian clock protein KaiC n=1 Tax=Halosimplex carlsbadense 2-9-1 TaxID=797114 RepID=M0CSU4_9EURY|nr:KaiC domain-containing protein [Halosimplex carlsbadense]ELZ25723.1 circadian clock protein KaiC [Halosimplex carlsbadense 2-9-1]